MTQSHWFFIVIVLSITLVVSIAIKLKMYHVHGVILLIAPFVPFLILYGTTRIIIEELKKSKGSFFAKCIIAFSYIKAMFYVFPILVGLTAYRLSKIKFERSIEISKIRAHNISMVSSSIIKSYKDFFDQSKQKNFKYA